MKLYQKVLDKEFEYTIHKFPFMEIVTQKGNEWVYLNTPIMNFDIAIPPKKYGKDWASFGIDLHLEFPHDKVRPWSASLVITFLWLTITPELWLGKNPHWRWENWLGDELEEK